jgi:hypothetical protein
LVRSDELAAGAALVTTHMPNAMEGLRVDASTSPAVPEGEAVAAKPDDASIRAARSGGAD